MQKKQKLSNLIFKNGWRNTFDSKFQFLGLIILFFFLGLIITSLNIVTRRVSQSLSLFYKQSLLHDAVANFSGTQITVEKNQPKPNDEMSVGYNHLTLLQEILQQLSAESNHQFYFTRKETRIFGIDHLWLKVIGYSNHQTVDKLIITEGSQLSSNPNFKRGIILESKFAQLHGLQIGDVIRVIPDSCGTSLRVKSINFKTWNHQIPFEDWIDNSKYASFAWYQIRGFGVSPDFTYPIISSTQQVVDKKLQGVAYVKNINFGLIYKPQDHLWTYDQSKDLLVDYNQSSTEIFYALRFRNYANAVHRCRQAVIAMNKELIGGFFYHGSTYYFHPLISGKLFFVRGDPGYLFARRVTFPFLLVRLYSITCLMILVFIAVITILATFFLIKQRVDRQKGQIGLLKAYGHTKTDIFVSFLIFPISVGLVGGVVGFLLALLVGNSFVGHFSLFLNFNLGVIFIPWIALLITVLCFFAVILLVTWTATIRWLTKSCVDLIYRPDIVIIKNSCIKIWLSRIFNRLSFWMRLKLRVTVTSIGKMNGIILVFCFGAILLGTSTFFGRALIDAKQYYFADQNFQVASFYQPPVWNVPTSFYRTYDFTNKQKLADALPVNKIIDQLMTHRISRDYYSLKSKLLARFNQIPFYLFQLTWKNFNSLNFKFLIKNGYVPDWLWTKLILPSLWPDYQQLTLQLDKYHLFCPEDPTADQNLPWPSSFSPSDFKSFSTEVRRFYLKYRTGLLLSVNKSLLWNLRIDPFSDGIINNNQFKVKEGPFVLNQKGGVDFTIDHHHLKDDQNVVNTLLWQKLSRSDKEEWVREMINWFNVTFFNRFLPALFQGIYSQAPYYVQQYFRQADYNLTFNIIPAASDDYLGTYLNARLNGRLFHVLGIGRDAVQKRFVQLGDSHQLQTAGFWDKPKPSSNGSPITETIPIVINQNLARINHLKRGDVIRDCNIKTPEVSGRVKGHPWPQENPLSDYYDFSDLLHIDQSPETDPKGFLINSLQLYQVKLKNLGKPYNPDDLIDPITPLVTALHDHQIFLNFVPRSPHFKVVAIQNNYGPPLAYINQAQANHLLHYELTQPVLYRLFRQIWKWSNLPHQVINKNNSDAIEAINNIKSLKKLKNQAVDQKSAYRALQMFNAAFPLFNFRLSHLTDPDLVHGVAVTDSFGDFSSYALNGHYNPDQATNDYVGYGNNVLDTAFDKTVAQQIMQKQLALMLLVMIFICIVFVSMSVVIISLTSDLIIDYNHYLIQNLRIIGYDDKKILRIICDCFFWFLPGALTLSVVCGWYILRLWAETWMLKLKILLPVIWHPTSIVLCIGVVTSLFLVAFGFSFLALKRTSLIKMIRQQRTSV